MKKERIADCFKKGEGWVTREKKLAMTNKWKKGRSLPKGRERDQRKKARSRPPNPSVNRCHTHLDLILGAGGSHQEEGTGGRD